MASDPSPRNKGLFGNRRLTPDDVVVDQDILRREEEERNLQAETRSAALEAQVSSLTEELRWRDEKISQLEAKLDAIQGSVETPGRGTAPPAAAPNFLQEELASILASAQEAAAQMVERARSTSETQLAHANQVWEEVQNAVGQFGGWREQVDPIIRTAEVKVEEVQDRIEEVSERIRQALIPFGESITAMRTELARLTRLPSPPLVQLPEGLKDKPDLSGPG
jgi:chromosome segregation ATPase